MIGTYIALILAFVGVIVILALLARWRRQMGGGFGPTELSDGSMTTEPTGYPEEMHGHAKKISPTDNDSADYK